MGQGKTQLSLNYQFEQNRAITEKHNWTYILQFSTIISFLLLKLSVLLAIVFLIQLQPMSTTCFRENFVRLF